ncbi:MAG: putative endonuclease [Marinobacter maritimus]|jgi:putative endonuclease|uniref:YraN family protein n=1 Tax=Marinobacter maritimus TaxID=277961 RepID=UPI000BC97282|nr:YraN family protein [Marinobacter maritimus]MBL1272930.1 YraN family protein [Oceanospirillales bacterium]|tara:strand:- start:2045 stop:2413 length:369 start_codon:yes stop_codon:yes gene_type:complete
MEGSKAIGTHFEGVAARYLSSRGVDILERNVYNRGGEIDLIGKDKDTLVFFEVRYRRMNSLVDPASSISYPKRQRLLKAASFYLHRHNLWNALSRIDVVAISPGTLKKYRVQWIKNAIQADV